MNVLADLTQPSLTQLGMAIVIGSFFLNLVLGLATIGLSIATYFRRTPPLEGQFLDQEDFNSYRQEMREAINRVWAELNANTSNNAGLAAALTLLQVQVNKLDIQSLRNLERQIPARRVTSDTQNLHR